MASCTPWRVVPNPALVTVVRFSVGATRAVAAATGRVAPSQMTLAIQNSKPAAITSPPAACSPRASAGIAQARASPTGAVRLAVDRADSSITPARAPASRVAMAAGSGSTDSSSPTHNPASTRNDMARQRTAALGASL